MFVKKITLMIVTQNLIKLVAKNSLMIAIFSLKNENDLGKYKNAWVVRLRIGSLYRYWFFNIFSSFWGIDQRNSENVSEKVIDSREKVIIPNFVSRSLEECFSSIDSYRLALISIPSKKWINWMKPKETYF